MNISTKYQNLLTDLHRARGTDTVKRGEPSPEAKKAAREFEAVFLTQAVEEMLKSVKIGDLSGGHAEETWRSFLARAYADELAAKGTTGIGKSVEHSIAAYGAAVKTGGSQ
jgi:Rod binding domain-containing protein